MGIQPFTRRWIPEMKNLGCEPTKTVAWQTDCKAQGEPWGCINTPSEPVRASVAGPSTVVGGAGFLDPVGDPAAVPRWPAASLTANGCGAARLWEANTRCTRDPLRGAG